MGELGKYGLLPSYTGFVVFGAEEYFWVCEG